MLDGALGLSGNLLILCAVDEEGVLFGFCQVNGEYVVPGILSGDILKTEFLSLLEKHSHVETA